MMPGKFESFEKELSIHKAIKYSKNWIVQRRWLKKNGIDFSDFDEEKEFKKLCEDFKFESKIMNV